MPTKSLLRAAGGVVWRRGGDGARQIALAHRPAYDDWSLPKGKPDHGEDAMETAVREVREEIGARVAVQARLGSAGYDTARGPKLVEHFVLEFLGGRFAPNAEVDEVRWLAPGDAARLVSYDADRDLIETFADLPPITATVALVRHARAGKRSEWDGPDVERPLSHRGEKQAHRLAHRLEPLQPQRILSAPPRRCIDTVRPLAARLGLDIEMAPWAGDIAHGDDPGRSAAALIDLARTGGRIVLSSQGDAIPGLLENIAGSTSDYATSKGAFWVLSFAGADLVGLDRHGATRPD